MATTRRFVVDGSHVLARPASTAHAKRVGTLVTACGLRCTTWVTFFDLDFPARGVDVCPRCVVGVGAPGQRRQGGGPRRTEPVGHRED